MSIVVGYGKKAQDWSYLTPRYAIAVQDGNVVNPALLDDSFNIDTTKTRKGDPVDRARQQMLVIFVIPKSGTTLAIDSILHLWAKVDWDDACEDTTSSSSACPDVGVSSDLSDADRWALAEFATHDGAHAAGFASALCFVFPWMPAGVYRAAIATGLTGEAVIAEQHTE